MNATVAAEKATKEVLAKEGQQAFVLKGAAGDRYVDTYMRYPWEHLMKNPAVKLDVGKLRQAFR